LALVTEEANNVTNLSKNASRSEDAFYVSLLIL